MGLEQSDVSQVSLSSNSSSPPEAALRNWQVYFFLLCCRRACSRWRAPVGFDPAPMEKAGVAGEPNGTALNPWTGVPGLPKGIGPAAALWPKDGVDVPNAGLSAAAAPKLKLPI